MTRGDDVTVSSDASEAPVVPVPDRVILRIVCAYAAAFVVFGFIVDGPDEVLRGLVAIVTSLAIGFILAPVAAQLFKAHMGFSLYNMGFTAGIVGTLVVAMYKSYGFVPEPVMIWTSGNNPLLGGFMAFLFASMVALGYYFDRGLPSRLKRIMAEAG